MNAFHAGVEFLRQWPMTQQLCRVLLHSLWQDAAIAAICAIVLYGMRRSAASGRYLLACAGLGLMVLMPIVTVVATRSAEHTTSPATVTIALPAKIASAKSALAVPSQVAPGAPSIAASDAAVTWWSWAVAIWFCGIAALSLRHVLGWTYLHHLMAHATPPAGALAARLSELAQEAGVRAKIRLLIVQREYVPATMGWLRPLILIPMSAATDLPPQHLEALLLHELAHIRR